MYPSKKVQLKKKSLPELESTLNKEIRTWKNEMDRPASWLSRRKKRRSFWTFVRASSLLPPNALDLINPPFSPRTPSHTQLGPSASQPPLTPLLLSIAKESFLSPSLKLTPAPPPSFPPLPFPPCPPPPPSSNERPTTLEEFQQLPSCLLLKSTSEDPTEMSILL